jgi:beta-lactam-binding protein with PASTA domain/tRNA A-37 threonylcarbamoyl transferase component Bud32
LNGTTLGGRYELIEIIGEGGMSTVYKARDRVLDRIVAVKILREEFSQDKGFVSSFKTEALSAASISHPNIVNIYDVGSENDVYFIVMEFVDGQTLKSIIRRQGPLSVERAVDIAIMVCDGVHHAHEKGIIHRDIKPQNILITEHGMVKVADFGIARAVSSGTLTYGNNIVGSVHYFSPEQARGEAINRTADIYSIGCVLYEMLTGKVPFNADSPITVALMHINDEPPSPRAINPEITPAVEAIILKAMAKLPAQRFQTAQEMRNTLLNLNKDMPATAAGSSSAAAPPSEPKGKKRKIRPLGIALIAIAILGLLSGVLYMVGGNLFGQEVAVPNIVGMDIKQADEELTKVSLVMNVLARQADDKVAKDAVISQDPAQGRKVKAGREINVVISDGSEQVKVPNITGVNQIEAGTRLANKGLNLGAIQEVYDEKYAAGMIISQMPLADATVNSGTNIDVVVSKGKQPAKVAMPSLLGLSQAAATKKLQDNKLVLGEVKSAASNSYFADQVATQDTTAGVIVDEGTKVNISISTGPGPGSKTKQLQFDLPSGSQNYNVVIKVTDAQGAREVYNAQRRAGDSISVSIKYYGTGTAQVLLNSKAFNTYSLP